METFKNVAAPLLGLLLAVGAAAETAAVFEDPLSHFKVVLPEGWKPDVGLEWKFRPPENGGPEVEFYFRSEARRQDARSLDRYYDETRTSDYRHGEHSNYAEISRGSVTVGGLAGRRFAFREDYRNLRRQGVQYVFFSSAAIMTLTYKAPDARFDDYLKDVETAVRTFPDGKRRKKAATK